MLPMLVCIVGIYVGLYFNFLTLLPFSVLGVVVSIVLTASAEQPLTDVPSALLSPVIVVQVGYVFGLIMRENYGHFLARFNLSPSKRA
jgi:hypothetical protein